MDFLSLIDAIFAFIENNFLLSLIVSSLITGEYGSHLVGVLVGSLDKSIFWVIVVYIFVVIGEVLTFSFYKFLKNTTLFKKIKFNEKKLEVYKEVKDILSKDEKSQYYTLAFLKCLPATHFFMFVFVSFYDISAKKFFKITLVTTLFFSPILFISGWLVGRSLINEFGGNLLFIVLYLFVILFFFSFLQKKVKNYIYSKKTKNQ